MVLTPRALELDARKARRNLYLAGQMTSKRRLYEAVFSPTLIDDLLRSRSYFHAGAQYPRLEFFPFPASKAILVEVPE